MLEKDSMSVAADTPDGLSDTMLREMICCAPQTTRKSSSTDHNNTAAQMILVFMMYLCSLVGVVSVEVGRH